ncbi:general stress protein [Pantoea dispersa]|uniref:general stress protein n=1 Tax=Pantoea dispersa TaxID=59814 RepID=UPI0028DE5FDF|nr:general stress protein [Pantoea dispersa]MDT8852019.1 general stress protein [Pantoea dispersa]
MTQRRGGAGNFAENTERAREAGKKGGSVSSGNFKNCPERAVEAGRRGGKVSRRGKTTTAEA